MVTVDKMMSDDEKSMVKGVVRTSRTCVLTTGGVIAIYTKSMVIEKKQRLQCGKRRNMAMVT